MCYSLKEGSGADLRVRDRRGLQTFGCVLVSQKLLLVLFCFTASAYMFIVVSIFCTSHLVVVPVHNTQRNYQTFLKVESVLNLIFFFFFLELRYFSLSVILKTYS